MRISVLLFLLALPASGQAPRLVKDINPTMVPGSSAPSSFVALGSAAVFAALESRTGNELWRSDGTAAGTWRLTDIFSGDRSSNPVPVASTGRQVFFTAEQSFEIPRSLWVTDGTPGGVLHLAAVNVREGGALWVPARETLYFVGSGESGAELWRSDGTPAGTEPVGGPAEAGNPSELTAFQGRVWFSAGGWLWRMDSADSLVPVKRFPGAGPRRLQVVGSRLLFVVPAPGGASELWASDGTARGLRPLVRLAQLLDFQVVGSRLWFVADDGRRGQELWVTDGTPAGTRVLTSFARREAFLPGFLPPTLTAGRFVFAADDGPHGVELWSTDGKGQARLVRDVCPGICPAVLSLWRTHRGLLYWAGTNGARGSELWVTDGTAAGTRLVRDICRGSCGADPREPSFLEDRVLFGAIDNGLGRDLWSTDGTAAGTVRLTDFKPLLPWLTFQSTVVGGALLFSAYDGEHGAELWRSDGTPAGTSLVLDLNDFEFGGSYPEAIGALGSQAFFFADDAVHGHELWKSDGTGAGTSLVLDISPGESPFRRFSYPGEEAGGRLFFIMEGELWRTDGTGAGTFALTGIATVSVCCSSPALRAYNGRVYFSAQDYGHGLELWTSDGTVAGTRMVRDLRPGSSEPTDLVVFQGNLYFTAAGEGGIRELWRSDGTEAGTVRVASLGVFHSGALSRLTVHAGRLWFFADDGEHGRELWSSDGTETGTGLAVDLDPGPGPVFPNLIVSVGERLLISGFLDSGDSVLWSTDGTPAGTRPVGPGADGSVAWIVSGGRLFYNAVFPFEPPAAIYVSDGTEEGTSPLPAPVGLSPALDFAPLGDRVLFNTDSGRALWMTDGTAAGTVRVTEEGFEPFEFGDLLPAGGRVFFPAYSPETGVEPWVVEP
ncbi:MAG: hypothetical protein ABUT39_08380 [Acidobacteriota bacterium]